MNCENPFFFHWMSSWSLSENSSIRKCLDPPWTGACVGMGSHGWPTWSLRRKGRRKHPGISRIISEYIHAELKYLPKMPDEAQRKYLFVAIGRPTRWIYLGIRASKSAASAASFLRNLLNKAHLRSGSFSPTMEKSLPTDFVTRARGTPPELIHLIWSVRNITSNIALDSVIKCTRYEG